MSQGHQVDELRHQILTLVLVIKGSLKRMHTDSMTAAANAGRLKCNYDALCHEINNVLEACGEVEEQVQMLTCNTKGEDDDQSNRR